MGMAGFPKDEVATCMGRTARADPYTAGGTPGE
jgi:hypothetical protein